MALDSDFLAEFDARLRELGAPIVDAWMPGCTDEEIDALLQPLGIDLPEEARVWWRWHNGTSDDVPMSHRMIGRRLPLPLEVVVEGYSNDSDMRKLFGLDRLIRPVDEKPYVFLDCAGRHDEPVPVYAQSDIDKPVVVLPSIRSLFEAWLELIDVAAWRLGADRVWQFSFERVPPHIVRLGVY